MNMFRSTRALLCALCLLTVGLTAIPASAQPAPGPIPMGAFTTPFSLIQTVRIVGAGETEAEALANALARLREDYLVLRYTLIRSFCTEVELPSTDPFGNHDTVMLCAAEVEARVIRKATIILPFP
jgi:hypothetical protein